MSARPGVAQASHKHLVLQEAGSWRDDALCAQTDPELFFPEKGGSVREAKLTCSLCTVTADCLEYALTNGEHHGIWGGHSENERRELLRRRGELAGPHGAGKPQHRRPESTNCLATTDLGRRLRAWRMNTGLTQTAAADRLGIPAHNLANYEIGRRMPAPSMLAAITALIGAPA